MSVGDGSNFGFESSAVADSDDQDLEHIARALMKDLGIKNDEVGLDLSLWVDGLLTAHPDVFRSIALDAAIFVGMSGDWNSSLRLTQRLVELNDERLTVKLWELRSFVDSGRFAEALALAQAVKWERAQLLHVNYLTGLAFESLGMREQSQLRFEAVRRQDPSYRDARFRL